jgi:hypothetical protein
MINLLQSNKGTGPLPLQSIAPTSLFTLKQPYKGLTPPLQVIPGGASALPQLPLYYQAQPVIAYLYSP